MTKNNNMSLIDALKSRRSVRGFKPDLIPEDEIKELLSLAQLTPSNCNTQPWRTLLARGESCNQLRQKMSETFLNGIPSNPDFSHITKFNGDLRTRQVACAQALYAAMGIAREDRPARHAASARNFAFFDAPHVMFIGMDKTFPASIAVDIGMYAQSIMLLMTTFGIASCAQASVANYPDVIRSFFNEPDTTGILFGISFGYEDASVPANRSKTNRETLDKILNEKID